MSNKSYKTIGVVAASGVILALAAFIFTTNATSSQKADSAAASMSVQSKKNATDKSLISSFESSMSKADSKMFAGYAATGNDAASSIIASADSEGSSNLAKWSSEYSSEIDSAEKSSDYDYPVYGVPSPGSSPDPDLGGGTRVPGTLQHAAPYDSTASAPKATVGVNPGWTQETPNN